MKTDVLREAGNEGMTGSDPFEELIEQLHEAYPTASYQLLSQALMECRKETKDPNDRERLIRCVRERITA